MQGERSHDESGSALLLVPAGILVMLILGAIVVDTAVVFLAEREAAAAASAAANDIATLAVDEGVLRTEGRYEVNPASLVDLEQIVRLTVNERLSGAFVDGSVQVSVVAVSPTALQVRVSGEARRLVGPFGWVGVAPTRTVSAVAIGSVVVTG